MIESAADLLVDPNLVVGLIAGLIVLGLGVLAWAVRGNEVQRYGGLLVAVATALLMYQADMLGGSQVAGVVVLAVAGFLHRFLALGPLLALPGAFLMVRPDVAGSQNWFAWFALLGIVIAGPLLASFDLRYWSTGLALPMFGIATLGVLLTVPDTEGALMLFGVAGVAGFLGWPTPFASYGTEGSYALAGVYVVVAAQGAIERPASIVPSVAVLGLLLIVPVVSRLRRGSWANHVDRIDAIGPLAAQLVLAVLLARTAGGVESVAGAAILTVVLLGAAAAIVLALPSPRPSRLPD